MAEYFDRKTNLKKYGLYFSQVNFWLCKDCAANKNGRTGSKEYSEKSLIEHFKFN